LPRVEPSRDGGYAPVPVLPPIVHPPGAVMARENLESIIGDLKARMKTIRDSL
jgi:hypothetical protein